MNTVGIWNPTVSIRTFWSDFKWSGFQRVRLNYTYGPNHLKTRQHKIRTFLFGFQMVCDKMAAIGPVFKWYSFPISDPIPNLDHLQADLFLTVRNPYKSWFQIPAVNHFVIGPFCPMTPFTRSAGLIPAHSFYVPHKMHQLWTKATI